jgi:hypothetical protein
MRMCSVIYVCVLGVLFAYSHWPSKATIIYWCCYLFALLFKSYEISNNGKLT